VAGYSEVSPLFLSVSPRPSKVKKLPFVFSLLTKMYGGNLKLDERLLAFFLIVVLCKYAEHYGLNLRTQGTGANIFHKVLCKFCSLYKNTFEAGTQSFK